MPKIGVSCRGCVFNVKGEDGVQKDCKIDVLEAFENNSTVFKIVDNNYQFDRICPYRSETTKTPEQAIEEAYLKFHFIVIDIDKDKTLEILENIKDIAGEKSRVSIITKKISQEVYDYISYKENYFLTTSFENDDDIINLIDKGFQKTLNGYTVVLTSEDKINKSDLDRINKFVNLKMQRLALVENSPFVINNVMFKFLKGNKGKSFKDKLVGLAEEQSTNSMVYTWEDINETVNS